MRGIKLPFRCKSPYILVLLIVGGIFCLSGRKALFGLDILR